MKRRFLLTALLALMSAAGVYAQHVNFLIHWEPQAQFAGYYVAMEKGFYKEAGLDVDLKHWNPNASYSSLDMLSSGQADIGTNLLMQGLIETMSNHLDVADVLQTSQKSGLLLVSHYDLTKVDLKKLSGKRVGRWKAGFGQEADMFVKKYGVNVEWIYFNTGINIFVSKAIDATLCYSYSEYLDLLLAVGEIPQSHIARFADHGYNFPEDAIFANKTYLKTNKAAVDKFVAASKKGWNYAARHPEEALDIVMKYIQDNNYHKNRVQQKMMLEEVLRLQINPDTSKRDFAPLKASVFNKLISELNGIGAVNGTLKYEEFVIR